MTGEVYALASGKGGVGKTTLTANLGVTLRSEGHSVALVDADLGMANLTTLLDVETNGTLHDVLAGDSTVDEALTEGADGFGILPGSRDLAGFAAADPNELGAVLDSLADRYDYVLVDTGGGLSYEDAIPLGLVDEIVLVTAPGPAAVGDTRKTMELAELVGGDVRGVIVNRTVDGVDAESVADDLGTELLGSIPTDEHVTESMLAGQPLEAHAPDSPAARAFDRLAATLTGFPVESGSTPESDDEGSSESAAAETATDNSDEMQADESTDTETEADDSTESAPEEAEKSSSGGLLGWFS